MIAFVIGVILDWIIGDPVWVPHPVRWIGAFISNLTDKLLGPYLLERRDQREEKQKGLYLVISVIAITILVVSLTLIVAYKLNPYIGVVVEAIETCYLMAAKSLYVESMKVSKALKEDGLQAGRQSVAMIVGRDTEALDEAGVIRAAVETVAENTSDGVIAPLLYACIGGPILGYLYKAVNTMDSMVGYHNDKYENFGYYAARLDDIVNYVPARISAHFMIIASYVMGHEYSGRGAIRIFKRDRYNHKSPNSAQTESVCAGALGVRLAGDASYFGKIVQKPYIGDASREIEVEDIKRAGILMYATQILTIIVCIMIALMIRMCMR